MKYKVGQKVRIKSDIEDTDMMNVSTYMFKYCGLTAVVMNSEFYHNTTIYGLKGHEDLIGWSWIEEWLEPYIDEAFKQDDELFKIK